MMVNDVLCAFRGMRGGDIRIEGTTGDYLGKHMCSRAINVNGNRGDVPVAFNRGGTLIIGCDAYLPGAEMASSSIVVNGKSSSFIPMPKAMFTRRPLTPIKIRGV